MTLHPTYYLELHSNTKCSFFGDVRYVYQAAFKEYHHEKEGLTCIPKFISYSWNKTNSPIDVIMTVMKILSKNI